MNGLRAAEVMPRRFMELDGAGRVVRVMAHYTLAIRE
jgi:hypothetical protein